MMTLSKLALSIMMVSMMVMASRSTASIKFFMIVDLDFYRDDVNDDNGVDKEEYD